MLKGSKSYSVLHNKCPRCQEGDFFVVKNAFDLKNFAHMHTHCSECGLRYMYEPGFFVGAMYVSYTFYVLAVVGVFVVFVGLLNMNEMTVLWGLIPALVLVTSIFFRLARLMWINLFVAYEPDAFKKHEEFHHQEL